MTTSAPDTFTVRAMWEGAILAEEAGLDWEDAKDAYTARASFYLNAPNAEDAKGVTIQLFTEATGYVEYETTF